MLKSTYYNENTMNRFRMYEATRQRSARGLDVRRTLSVLAVAAIAWTASHAQAQWDTPLNHPLSFNDWNMIAGNIEYGPEFLPWTNETRVLAIQPIHNNADLILKTNDGNVWVSQYQDWKEVDFVLFDGSEIWDASGQDPRPNPECTAELYSSDTAAGGVFYLQYVKARDFNEWDGYDGYADFSMDSADLVQARRVYLKAGVAYRFDIDRADPNQAGLASLMPTNYQSRIQTRPQAVAEFRWWAGGHDDLVYAPEEGWYTLVIAQTNGRALGLGLRTNTIEIGRGDYPGVMNNNIRVSVHAE
jgi:hypothetical protein